jgi:hypothetical protein
MPQDITTMSEHALLRSSRRKGEELGVRVAAPGTASGVRQMSYCMQHWPALGCYQARR